MTSPDRAQLLASASAERRGAHTLITDPNCEPNTAHSLLYRAWRATAWLSRGEVPDGAGEDLSSWLAPAHLALIRERRRARIHKTLVALAALADPPEAWTVADPDPGKPDQAPPSPRELRASALALAKVHEALTLELAGRSIRAKRALRWVARGAVASALLGLLGLAIVRPWQSDDIGPWRVAYYPSVKFKGEPDLRRAVDVDFDWGKKPPLDSIPSDLFSARFDTCLTLEEETEVAFMLVSDDGSRLLIDGEKMVDNWNRNKGKPKKQRVRGERFTLDAGVHHLRVEFHERSGNAEVTLRGSFDPDEMPAQIPESLLTYPGEELDEDDPCAGAI